MAPNLAWGGYRNGRIPRSSLVDIGGGKLLQADAARQFVKLTTAFRRVWGAALYLADYQDAYRDVARQQYMLDHPAQYPHAKAAAGTSVHGWARSVDVSGYGAGGSARHTWLVKNAPNFGWSWDYGRALGESWHFDYVGPITTTAGDTTTPFVTNEELNMFIISSAENPEQKVLITYDGGLPRARYLENLAERAVILAVKPPLPEAVCDGPTFSAYLDLLGYQYGAPVPLLPVAATVTADVKLPAGVATKADVDAAAAAVAKVIPSAEQNGAAARAAIVR